MIDILLTGMLVGLVVFHVHWHRELARAVWRHKALWLETHVLYDELEEALEMLEEKLEEELAAETGLPEKRKTPSLSC